ncbi:dinitrogenase iron-molybdenum cofactor biosynthesis protein [Sulfurospirillum sp. T05]|uniref:Dinitrogenase iron-molybdenum cofactor biosynthesis protein n=1 Tax=Sulfurospirillum tamanense TaxID=2813362 RepID=A0ABS2WV29_9BACT|nr:NifB/NifX family molybdenum-iron cluster-binding protein [Sulfurospirillum tamanensis]MBN2965228.1 dinitrogenase iron-molybdenum cofactor biosynthesis protein [Sulfurospirillum tamanensis]
MRLVFPTNKNMGKLSPMDGHFGKAKFYTVVTLGEGEIVEVATVENPGHQEGGCGNAVINIMNLSPDALIVTGIGGRPAEGFSKAGLPLYFDKSSKTVEESVQAFLANSLQRSAGEGTCKAH